MTALDIHWSLYDICKQKGYTKGMFSHALNFCFSTLSPTVSDFYLAVDMDNCHYNRVISEIL